MCCICRWDPPLKLFKKLICCGKLGPPKVWNLLQPNDEKLLKIDHLQFCGLTHISIFWQIRGFCVCSNYQAQWQQSILQCVHNYYHCWLPSMQGFKHPLCWPSSYHHCGKHDLRRTGVGPAEEHAKDLHHGWEPAEQGRHQSGQGHLPNFFLNILFASAGEPL